MILQKTHIFLTTRNSEYATMFFKRISWEGKMKKIFAMLFLYQSITNAKPFEAPPQTPLLLAQAQEAYLNSDFSMALKRIKQAYVGSVNDSVSQKNAVSLFKQIQNQKLQPNLDVGWTLPAEIPSFKAQVVRRLEEGNVTNQLIIAGESKTLGEIESFRLIRYPEFVYLDKSKNIGKFQESQKDGNPEFNYRAKATVEAVPEGLYLFTMTTKSGSLVDGWFILDDGANSTTSPEYVNFTNNTVFKTGTPQINWMDFISPQYNPKRFLSVWIGNAHVDEGAFSFWTSDMNTRSLIIGSDISSDHGWGKGPLPDGDYYSLLQFSESKNFGPMKIGRRSSTAKYFTIKR